MFREMMRLALGNISRARLRYVLTMFGIMIGTGAIVSMVSYAVGMHRQISEAVASSGLLTTIYVLPGGSLESFGHDPTDPDDVDYPAEEDSSSSGTLQNRDELGGGKSGSKHGGQTVPGDKSETQDVATEGTTGRLPVTDELIDKISSIEGVERAFPILAFPAVVTRGPHNAVTTVSGLPSHIGETIQKRLETGKTFAGETDSTILITSSLARRLGVNPQSLDEPIPVTLTVVTLARRPSLLFSFGFGMPFERRSYRFHVTGILKESMGGPIGRMDAYIPLGIAREIAAVAMQQARDILKNLSFEAGGYVGAEVHVRSLAAMQTVNREITAMGLPTFSVSDQLKEMRTAFVVLSGFLGAIGGVALFVGCLGIMNVMLISVFERTRDIGIMKSVGARKRDVLHLFVIESGLIGVVGGFLGVLLGWLVAEITNHIMFAFVIKGQIPYQQLYQIPSWLAGGATALAILVSILAGLYPARRAAKLDPVAALRYE